MKTIRLFFVFLSLLECSNLFGALPQEPLLELKSGKIKRTMTKVEDIPAPLRTALAKTFQQNSLELGNPHDRIGGSVTYTGDPSRRAASRRLIFAFETKQYAFVYYESGDPENSAACLVFSVSNPQSPRFVWGGADMKKPFAKSPAQLRAKILHGKLPDNFPFIW